MSRHQRFAAALLLIAATLGLGACASKDPTGIGDPTDPPGVAACTSGGNPIQTGGVHARLYACGDY